MLKMKFAEENRSQDNTQHWRKKKGNFETEKPAALKRPHKMMGNDRFSQELQGTGYQQKYDEKNYESAHM